MSLTLVKDEVYLAEEKEVVYWLREPSPNPCEIEEYEALSYALDWA